MTKYPIDFIAASETKNGVGSTWSVESYGHKTICAIPPEFNGPGGGFSPEDLFAQALTNCLIATFKVYAENSKLTFEDLKVLTVLSVDQIENRKVIMKKCNFHVTMTGASSPEKAQLLIKKSFESGFILNSVKTELSYELHLN
jgi:organic hydroperoxide reductase OsmC/OhrA